MKITDQTTKQIFERHAGHLGEAMDIAFGLNATAKALEAVLIEAVDDASCADSNAEQARWVLKLVRIAIDQLQGELWNCHSLVCDLDKRMPPETPARTNGARPDLAKGAA